MQPDYDLASQLQPVYGVIYYKAGNAYVVETQNKDEALDLYHNVIPPRGLESYLGCEKELVRRYSFDAWETIEEEDV